MPKNEFEYLKGVSHQEEYPQYEAPTMESYDPSSDDGDLPYIPSLGGGASAYKNINQPKKPIQFLDLNNPNAGALPTNNQSSNVNDTFQKTMASFEAQKRPSFTSAEDNFNRMMSVLDGVADIVGSSTAKGEDVDKYGIKVALTQVKECIAALTHIKDWIPEGKEEYLPVLNQAAKPILTALESFHYNVTKLSTKSIN